MSYEAMEDRLQTVAVRLAVGKKSMQALEMEQRAVNAKKVTLGEAIAGEMRNWRRQAMMSY